MVLDAFQQRKTVVLAGLQADGGDKSRKGSVDAPVADLVSRINAHPALYTTSSCSGRITVFGEPTAESRGSGKKGGEWVYASHDPADPQEVISAIHSRCGSGARLVLRFEPFILALEANSPAMGQQVLAAARAAGFRESGMTLGSGGRRVMVGVRCSLRLEVPVADAGAVLVPDSYLAYLVGLANDKFQQNLDRIRRFEEELFLVLEEPSALASVGSGEIGVDARRLGSRRQRVKAAGTDVDVYAGGVLAVPPPRRRATAANDGTGGVSEAAKKALKTRQARILGRILSLEIRLGVGHVAAGDASSDAGIPITTAIVAAASAVAAAPAATSLSAAGPHGSSPGKPLRWKPILPVSLCQSGVDEAVPRWGHASAVHGDCIYLLGGYGGGGAHARRGDVLVYDTGRRTWDALDIGGLTPPPRMGHTAVSVGDGYIVLVGGRTSPVDALADVWILDLQAKSWSKAQLVVDSTTSSGAPCAHTFFPGRYRHSAVSVPPLQGGAVGTGEEDSGSGVDTVCHRLKSLDGWRVIVFGGRNGDTVLGDTWVLSRDPRVSDGGVLASGWRWQQVAPDSDTPSPRKSHAACWVPGAAAPISASASAAAAPPTSWGRMYVHGGTCGYGLHFDDTFYLDLDSYRWHRCEMRHGSGAVDEGATAAVAAASQSPACFSHTISRWGPLLMLVGGYPTDHHRQLCVLDTRSHRWNAVGTEVETATMASTATAGPAGSAVAATPPPAPPMEFVPIRHCAEVVGNSLYVMGGGAFCFSFGTVFGGCFELDLGGSGGCHGGDGPLLQALLKAREVGAEPQCPRVPPKTAGAEDTDIHNHQGIQRTKTGHAAVAPEPVVTVAVASPEPAPASAPSGSKTAAAAPSTATPTAAALTATTPTEPKPWAQRPRQNLETGADAATGGDGSESDRDVTTGWVIRVPSRKAKGVKDALKAVGLLDTRRRSGVELVGPAAATPADTAGNGSDASASPLSRCQAGQWVLLPVIEGAPTVLRIPAEGNEKAAELTALLDRTGAQLVWTALPGSTKSPISPAQRLRDYVAALLRSSTLAGGAALPNAPALVLELLTDLPSRWERLGDLVMLPAGSLTHPGWRTALAATAAGNRETAVVTVEAADVLLPLWRAVAKALGVERLARQAPVANTGTRDSRAVLLLGSHGWVAHREGGVSFQLDVTRCMFSSGNVTERTRMGWGRGLIGAAGGTGGKPGWASGETVVDLYTGIGYYTLPLLVVAGVAKVYACEWNPHALEALHRNLQQSPMAAAIAAATGASASTFSSSSSCSSGGAAAPVASRCEVLAGDCRLRSPVGVADRVLLGLLPSSRGGWEVAIRALKPDTGGWLHLHHNVTDSKEAQWLCDTMGELRRLAAVAGRTWELRLHHVERVKWYAPHIRHIVMDIECRPMGHADHPAQEERSVTNLVYPGKADSHQPSRASASRPQPSAPRVEGLTAAPTSPSSSSATVIVAVGPSSRRSNATATVTNGHASIDANGNVGGTANDGHLLNPGALRCSEDGKPAGLHWYEKSCDTLPHVQRVQGVFTQEAFERDISPGREPVVLEGLDLGSAPRLWTPEYLMSLPAAKSTLVSVHVSREPNGRLDFVHKNFAFRIMSLEELVARMAGVPPIGSCEAAGADGVDGGATASAPTASAAEGSRGGPGNTKGEWHELVPRGGHYGEGPEVLYLRSIGENPRREPANLAASFPSLAADLTLPPLFDPDKLHSSVLRMSSPGLVLWTHYDVLDNLLIQVRGTKRVLLWPPACHDSLHVEGSSSPITRLSSPDLHQYPRFAKCPPPVVADLVPGDVLFLPSLWFHNVTTTGAEMSISVNTFWRNMAPEFYHRKDLYGNRDLVQAEEADKAAEEALAQLACLPPHYRDFYGARLLGRLRRQLGL